MSMYLGDRKVIKVRVSWSMEWRDIVGAFDGLVVTHIDHSPHVGVSDYYVLGHDFDIVKQGCKIPSYVIVGKRLDDGSNEFKFVRIGDNHE